MENDRSYAALLARRYFHEQSVEKKLLLGSFSRTTDPLIAELLDLLADEPWRAKGAAYPNKKYMPDVEALLDQLNKGPLGRLPEPGRFSAKAALWRPVGSLLAVVCTVMGAVTRASLDMWLVLSLVAAPIFAIIELIGFRDAMARYIRSRERRDMTVTRADCLSESEALNLQEPDDSATGTMLAADRSYGTNGMLNASRRA
ncbi:MAG TPA: hypothetical protein VN380_06095 [Thermoanaerobaculia bacterium]|nr:hypothetical protein [Thermoanaerobaculia bacterium]